jgi:peptide/nickel transport system substrate-binding protein
MTRRMSRLVASLAIAGMLVTACSSGHTSSAPRSSAAVPSVAPAAVGSLASVTWDLPNGEPSSLDPALAADYNSSSTTSNMCESLLRFNAAGKLVPWLASSWSQPNPKTIVFTVRSGVTFWDGKPMTAADVAYSLSRVMSPALASFWADPWFTDIASIRQTGSDQVTVSFTQPDAVFAEVMTTNAGDIGEASYIKAAGAKYGTATGGLMCTGPYQFEKWNVGQNIVMQRNDSYWDKSGAAKTKTVTLDFITDPNTLTNALLSGQIDGSYEVPVSAVSRLSSSGVGTLYLGSSSEFALMNSTEKAGPDLNASVRKALSLAIDRAAIAKSIYQSTALPVWSMVFPAVMGYGTSALRSAYQSLPGSTVDTTEAKSLVQSSGVDTSQTMTVAVSTADPSLVQIATYLQSVAPQIGLHIQVSQLPAAKFAQVQFDPKARDEYNFILATGYYDFADPIEQMMFGALPGSFFNFSGYSNPALTADINQARGTTDLATRAELLNKALTIWVGAQQDGILLANPLERVFMNKRVTGAPTTMPTYLYTPWAAALGAPKAGS